MTKQDILVQITEKLLDEQLINTADFPSVPEAVGHVAAIIDDCMKDYVFVPRVAVIGEGEKRT